MPDQVRVLSRRTRRTTPSPGLTLGTLALAAVLVAAAFTAGRLTRRSTATPSPAAVQASPQTTDTTASSSASTSSAASAGGAYPDTCDGGVAALLAATQTLSNPRILLDPSRRAQALSQIATTGYAATFTGSGKGAKALARIQQTTPLGRGLASGARTVYLAVPVSYRVAAYSPQSITVVGYGVSVIANDAGLSPRDSWATTTATAVWRDGAWKVSRVQTADGPTPAPTDRASSATALLTTLSGTQEIQDAP